MRLRHLLLPIALVTPLALALSSHGASAFAVQACHDDVGISRTNSHGSPLNGTFGSVGAAPNHSDSYYYLDVKTGPGCGVGGDGLVHAVGHVTANGVGLLPGCTPSTNWGPPCSPGFRRVVEPALKSEDPTWSFEFKNAATGAIIACTGGNGSGGTDCPGTPNITAVPGDATVEFRYDGPITQLRFRIANEYDDPIWEYATLDIVPCSTCEPSGAATPAPSPTAAPTSTPAPTGTPGPACATQTTQTFTGAAGAGSSTSDYVHPAAAGALTSRLTWTPSTKVNAIVYSSSLSVVGQTSGSTGPLTLALTLPMDADYKVKVQNTGSQPITFTLSVTHC